MIGSDILLLDPVEVFGEDARAGFDALAAGDLFNALALISGGLLSEDGPMMDFVICLCLCCF